MNIDADGVTPVPRLLLLGGFQLRSGFHVDLDRPVFVAAGDRVSYEDGAVDVIRPSGERQRHPARVGYWICR
ncbi:hypothetical protein ACFXI0_29395 [Kitasatospora indigofera]|uniref:hypothetical protein n=1 Tax=Kitasatospora indigofera TaxID=67307 RepID=UPI00369CEA4C